VQGKVLEVARPLVFLYLLHQHPPTSLSAHKLFCAILRHVDMVSALAVQPECCLARLSSALEGSVPDVQSAFASGCAFGPSLKVICSMS
jgi:hypothetical protein